MTFTIPVPFAVYLALHLLPTVVVLVCAWIVLRAVRIKVVL